MAKVPAEELFVFADRTRIFQAVGNLLANAGKFTPAGGRVLLSLERAGGRAVLRVRDTGVGINEEMLARIFLPFAQADRTLDRSRGGLGLGLSLVKGMVELHGGTVAAKSEGPGKGAEFAIELPLHGEGGAASALEPRVEALAGRQGKPRRRVLIVEDNRDAAESLREAVELMGHEVAVAHDGAEGLAAARAFSPDVVLCDVGLPGMSGYEVARRLRADRRLRRLPLLVAVTGYALPEDQQRAAEAGFMHHLAKPPSLDALERLLNREEGQGPLGAEAPQREEAEAEVEEAAAGSARAE
ncbi:MAG: ATP-binding protein [Myxococcales bacterium]